MKLEAKVIGLESGYLFSDGISRVRLRFVKADPMFQDIRIPQVFEQTLEMDDLVTFEIVGIDTRFTKSFDTHEAKLPDKF